MVIRVRDPFATLLSVQRAMEDVMRSNDWFGSHTAGAGAFPPINAFGDGEDFVIVAELPGVQKEDLSVEVRGDTVRIRGKKVVAHEASASVHRRERTSGDFDRTLTLPGQIDSSNVTADYADGVLVLRLPRAASERARSVTIN